MIDLHLHLDGSLTAEEIITLAKEGGVQLPVEEKDLEAALSAPVNCQSLNQYLQCFNIPTMGLQSANALSLATEGLCSRLARQGCWYVEIRFAPQLHTAAGFSQRDIVEGAVRGMKAAEIRHPGFSAQLILCCMRGGGDKENRETIKAGEEFLNKGVCAVDLAGAEALYPTKDYKELFGYAKSLGLPCTLHAGEAAGPESIWQALSFDVQRIGHGVRAIEDPALVEELAKRQIPLELCLTSNLQTKAVPNISAFPLREYLSRGIKATLNTDNMTVSKTTLDNEYRLAREQLKITPQEERTLLLNAAEAAFLPVDRKAELKRRIEARFIP